MTAPARGSAGAGNPQHCLDKSMVIRSGMRGASPLAQTPRFALRPPGITQAKTIQESFLGDLNRGSKKSGIMDPGRP